VFVLNQEKGDYPWATGYPLTLTTKCKRKKVCIMVKFLKPGKVVLVLNGRQAGKKAVIVKQYDDGTKERPYPHCIVAGVERYPRKVTAGMGKKKVEKRSKIKPFLKVVNYQHLMPTRYTFDFDLKVSLGDQSERIAQRKAIKKLFEERYQTGKNKWFFQKLRF
jgi:large subunit ribosomal protein L27e